MICAWMKNSCWCVCVCALCGGCLLGNERQQCIVATAGAWCRWARGKKHPQNILEILSSRVSLMLALTFKAPTPQNGHTHSIFQNCKFMEIGEVM